jgi:DinB superfamily
MTMQQHMAAALQQNLEMVKMTLADFSDADMLVRPLANANHTAWQVGHVICSETRMIEAVKPGFMPKLPAGFADKFTKATATSNDPAAFPSKAELLGAYQQQRDATIAWAQSLSSADLDVATPEPMRSFIPTIASLVMLIPSHLTMHVGQIQVIRRKLGKPILF